MKIGQYAIKRIIASGGMGTVYEALQENPRRPAAVKVVRRSMASTESLRRFEREAQALARLRHPGIAQIYEAGTYEDAGVSLPFFALEYIPNARTIIEYAEAKHLGVREKLDLFLQVCDAVHYGHQRGIIHRDLKPGNILVDSEGRARVIDFGVARAVDADQQEADAQTRVGQIIGTVQYMSPEQFEADPNDLDTRSDVYALGVVLYQLLTSRLPYRIKQSGVMEIARIISEEQPAPIKSVVAGIDDELGQVVSKALKKDREKRYQSAFGLAEDIRRHLRGEAIAAKTSNLSYQAKVFARKNKAVVGLGAAVAALLLVGIAWTSKLYVEVSKEQARAEAAAQQAIAANEFLKSTLEAVVPPGFGDVRTIGDLCDQVIEDIDDAFPDDPATEADIRFSIGNIYSRLDRRAEAELQLKKAYKLRSENLGRTHELTMAALDGLNTYYQVFGPASGFLETCREYYEIVVEKYGPEHDEALFAQEWIIDGLAMTGAHSAAERETRKLREAIEDRWGGGSEEALYIRRKHARKLLAAGQVEAALVVAEEVLQMCEASDEASPGFRRGANNTYAAALVANGKIDAAKEFYGNKPPPRPLGIEEGYQGSIVDLDEGIKVLILFETWCPYSQRFIREVEEMNRQYRHLGVEFVGLTSTSRSSTDAKVRQFITDYELTFSVFKEPGRCYNYFDMVGTPKTVVLHDGEVIWESENAGWLNNRILEGVANAEGVSN